MKRRRAANWIIEILCIFSGFLRFAGFVNAKFAALQRSQYQLLALEVDHLYSLDNLQQYNY